MSGKAKRIWAMILAIVVIFSLTACSTASSDEETSGEIVLTDVIGRQVVLEEPATLVVGTHNPTLNAAVVLGGGGKFIGGFGNKEMSRGLYEAVIPDFDNLTQIGKGGNINYETVLQTGADLAIIPERFQDQVAQFEEIGMNVLVALPSEESFETVTASLTLLGQALGVSDRADEINAFLEAKIDNAKEITAQVTDKKKVLFLGGSSPLSVAPDAMIQTDLIEVAGGENAVTGVEGSGDFVDVNIEQIIEWNPDVIWFPSYADYTVDSLMSDPAWANINAVKNNQVYVFPSTIEPWDQPTAALSLGIAWATHNLNPELYTQEDIMNDADEFYNMVYGMTFTAEQLGINQ